MITNKTKRKTISKKELVCKNIFSQALGLMFRRKQNLVIIFNKEKKISLHNFFVFFPIDVLILDANKKVVEIKKNFKPFTLWNSKEKGKYVVEFGYRSDYKVGDNLFFPKKNL